MKFKYINDSLSRTTDRHVEGRKTVVHLLPDPGHALKAFFFLLLTDVTLLK